MRKHLITNHSTECFILNSHKKLAKLNKCVSSTLTKPIVLHSSLSISNLKVHHKTYQYKHHRVFPSSPCEHTEHLAPKPFTEILESFFFMRKLPEKRLSLQASFFCFYPRVSKERIHFILF